MSNNYNKFIDIMKEEMIRVRLDNKLSPKMKMEILKSFENVIKNINKMKEMNDDLER